MLASIPPCSKGVSARLTSIAFFVKNVNPNAPPVTCKPGITRALVPPPKAPPAKAPVVPPIAALRPDNPRPKVYPAAP